MTSNSIGTLYAADGPPAKKAILATVAIAGLKIDIAPYIHGETNQSPEFLAKFPMGKVPAFEGKDGFLLTEFAAVLRYVASLSPNSTALGSSREEAALVHQWVTFVSSEVGGNLNGIHTTIERVPYIEAVEMSHREQLKRAMTVFENHLNVHTFLVGEQISQGDIMAALVLQHGFASVFDADFRTSHPSTVRYYNTIVNQPLLKEIYGETQWVEKGIQWTPKEEKEADEDDNDDNDNSVPDEPKAKNPLDSLPKSKFNLEDWKRAYSNKETRGTGGSIEWFHEKFDPEGFSVWKVTFKYPEELTQVFMSSNQIGGFYNRLEASRKYLFGSVGVLGESNNSLITGVLILRGPDVKPVVEVAPDWESYSYEKLDYKGADKEFFEAALAWDLEVGGKNWADGKNFK